MSSAINRRNWIKRSALLTGGMAVLPNLFSSLKAAPRNIITPEFDERFLTDDQISYETTPTEIKSRLCFNENPFGPSAKAKQAIADAVNKSYQYPLYADQIMTEKIAAFEGIDEKQILIDAGSSPLLLAAAQTYGKGVIVSANPTYEDLLKHAEALGTKVQRVALTPDYKFDLEAIEQAVDETTSLVYICNPNNPTGTVVDTAKLKSFCERISKKTMVFIDEAYMDLVADPAATTMIPLVKSGSNIIVARTFSKLYGMAGLRFGYVVAQPETIAKLTKRTNGSQNVSAVTWAAAIVSYQDKEFMKYSYDNIMRSKQALYDILKKQGYEYVPTSTNFMIFPVKKDSEEFVKDMMKSGVAVRSWRFAKKEWCRVSIGTLDEIKTFGEALALVS